MVENIKSITVEDLWAEEWKKAKSFFRSKGNIKTLSRLKKEWKESFVASLKTMYYARK